MLPYRDPSPAVPESPACPLERQLRLWFDRDFSMEKWEETSLAINIAVADVYKFAIEYSRSRKWRKTGVLWWSLLDMWPMMFNYSVVDYNFRFKTTTYEWIRQSQQPLCLILQESADRRQLALYAANDTLEAPRGGYRVFSVDDKGRKKELWSGRFAAKRNATTVVRRAPAIRSKSLLVIEWETENGDGKQVNHYLVGRKPYDFAVMRRLHELLMLQYTSSPTGS